MKDESSSSSSMSCSAADWSKPTAKNERTEKYGTRSQCIYIVLIRSNKMRCLAARSLLAE